MITGNLQKKHGKYYAVLNLKDENGKRYQKWISTGITLKGKKREAEEFLAEQIKKIIKAKPAAQARRGPNIHTYSLFSL